MPPVASSSTPSVCAPPETPTLLRSAREESERLRELAEYGILDTEPERELDGLTRLAATICGTPIALISFVDESRQWFKSRYQFDPEETPRSSSFCVHALYGSGVLVVPDATQDPRFAENPLVTGSPHIRFYAGAPLITPAGRTLGALCVIDHEPRHLSPAQLDALQTLSQQVMTHLNLRRHRNELAAREERYRLLVDTLAEGVVQQEPDGRIIAANHAAERILGLTADQLHGRTSFDPRWRAIREDGSPFPGEEHPAMIALRTGRTLFGVTMGVHRPDGSLAWISINATPLLNEDGKTVRSVVCSFADITTRKRSQLFADEHRRVLEKMASGAQLEETITALIHMVERQCPEMVCSVLRLSDDGRTLHHLAAPSLPEAVRAACESLAIGPDVGCCGTAAFTQQPTLSEDIAADPRWEKVQELFVGSGLRACWSTPFFDRDRRVLGTFAAYFAKPTRPTDEHQRFIDLATHAAAIALSRFRDESAVRESERRYRELVAAMPVGVYTTDTKGRMTLFNEAAVELWGRRPIAGQDCWTGWARILDVDGTPLPQEQWPIVRVHQERTPLRGIECIGERATGERVHFLSYPRPMFGPDGKFTGTTSVIVDISQRKAAEAALQVAYDDLRRTQEIVLQQERLRAFGQMASGVAHDINNAICPISIYAKVLLKNDPTLSSQAREYLEIIQQATRAVSDTVSRLRKFYREEPDQSGLVPIHLSTLIEEVKALTRARWSDMAQERGAVIDLQTDVAIDLPTITGSESEIREALINLIFNAVDAMPDGGTISLRASSVEALAGETPHVCLEVRDTGTGMSPEALKRCLEPFFTTKGERGTGLGLSIVSSIAQRHHAEMRIESQPGVGTTVRILFPTEATAPVPVTLRPVRAVVPPRKILVADDDPLILHAMRTALESDGHRPHCVAGGQAAISAFRTALEAGEPFDCVFTDLGMPYVDGRKVVAAVKAARPETPVFLLTGWGHSMQADAQVPPGVDRLLPKPVSPVELVQALADFPSPPAA